VRAILAVAECVALSIRTNGQPNRSSIFESLQGLCSESEWQSVVSQIESYLAADHSVEEFARALDLERGVSGYALHVVPVALYARLRHPDDFRTPLIHALECGGDTDTVGAIVGGLIGARVGQSEIPSEWRDAICEWPRSIRFMRRLAERLSEQKLAQKPLGAVSYFWPALLPRNILFLLVTLTHGFRRLAPPY
jgi:ADP-ribosylglycohydrolase